MEDKLIDNEILGQHIANFEADPEKAQAITRVAFWTDDYDNFKRLKSANCRLQLDSIILDVQQGTVLDESLRSTLEWLLANTVSKLQRFVLNVYTPTQALLDFILPLLDNPALDLSESSNVLGVFDESHTRIEEAVYRRSAQLLDYFPSLTVRFEWGWPLIELNSTNTILVKEALQAKSVRTVIFSELDLDAGDQLGKVIGDEINRVYLSELIFEKTHLSLGRFPHEIVEKSLNLTKLIIEYHPDNQQHMMMGLPFITVCETSFVAIRRTLEAARSITNLQLFNITNLKTNDEFKIADCMPNLEYLEIRNSPNKPIDHPSYLNLDLTLTDIASLCGPALKHMWLQVSALAVVTGQPIDQYIKAALVEIKQKCPNLEVLHIQSFQSYQDIKYRDDQRLMRRSLVADNHSSTVHDRLVAQADTCKFSPAKLNAFTLAFTGDKNEHVIFRRVFKWKKDWGYARLVNLDYHVNNPGDFNRKVVHLPIELEGFHGVPDLIIHNWADIIKDFPQAEDKIKPD